MKRPRYIAVIEDRAEDRFFLRHALNEASIPFVLVEFSSGEDALDYLGTADRPRLDLILVDISMPRMSGFEFADAFEDLYPEFKGEAKVFVLSSSIDPLDQETAQSHPAISGYLEKPPRAELLADLLR